MFTVIGVLLLAGILLLSGCESDGSGGGSGVKVSATREGVTYTASEAGLYAFTISGGAYSPTDPPSAWYTRLFAYRNRPVQWDARGDAANPDARIGPFTPFASASEAEAAGTGSGWQVSLDAGEQVVFVVPDSLGEFGDNSGSIRLSVARN